MEAFCPILPYVALYIYIYKYLYVCVCIHLFASNFASRGISELMPSMQILGSSCLGDLHLARCCTPIFTTMGWEWNAEDPQELHGWVWVEGQWHWGAAHTWHVVDVTWPHHRQWPTPKYFWICNHWRWLPSDGTLSGGYWLGKELHTYEELDETNTEDWMVHPLEPQHIAHEICNVKNIT